MNTRRGFAAGGSPSNLVTVPSPPPARPGSAPGVALAPTAVPAVVRSPRLGGPGGRATAGDAASLRVGARPSRRRPPRPALRPAAAVAQRPGEVAEPHRLYFEPVSRRSAGRRGGIRWPDSTSRLSWATPPELRSCARCRTPSLPPASPYKTQHAAAADGDCAPLRRAPACGASITIPDRVESSRLLLKHGCCLTPSATRAVWSRSQHANGQSVWAPGTHRGHLRALHRRYTGGEGQNPRRVRRDFGIPSEARYPPSDGGSGGARVQGKGCPPEGL